MELIEGYDILCFVETKTDDADEINLPGFILHMKNRFTFKRVKWGAHIQFQIKHLEADETDFCSI
jgi:hypothetical protein